ncbi:M48 family metallopeptidase [Planococcus salinus]|uniref:Heat-shock protein HtpX n=1 Tax=Planococcus salinus TaxID=1848460 RepID=A0A3M8P9L4_9BACL|nr:M48 family metallopeptidase [Planococcus salinus]RNF40379.1 heat-shock protein HtpX [Planococcus salinus]
MNHSRVQSKRESIYFLISLLVSVLIYLAVIVSVVGVAIALAIFALLLFTHALMLGSIRGNGIRIHERQFPDVYERVQTLSKEMGLKKVPDVFVIQSEGALNAFATRFFGRDMVVLYSEVFELAREQGEDELSFIIAHELAHIKRRHVWKNLLILPAGFIPFLSQAYSRSCEYTCDRHAAFAIQNAAAAQQALTLLGVGKKMYREVNEEAYRQQIATESNGFVWLSEVLSTHPRLPKRIQAIQRFDNSELPVYAPNRGKIALGATVLFGSMVAVYFLSVAIFTGGTMVYSQFFTSAMDEMLSYEEEFLIEGQTPLMTAASAGEYDEVVSLVEEGADVLEKDSEGADALMYAIYAGDTEIMSYLLSEGADPNTEDLYSTAVGTAVLYGEYDSALLLLENGANPSKAGADGMTAMDYMEASSEEELIELLQTSEY